MTWETAKKCRVFVSGWGRHCGPYHPASVIRGATTDEKTTTYKGICPDCSRIYPPRTVNADYNLPVHRSRCWAAQLYTEATYKHGSVLSPPTIHKNMACMAPISQENPPPPGPENGVERSGLSSSLQPSSYTYSNQWEDVLSRRLTGLPAIVNGRLVHMDNSVHLVCMAFDRFPVL